MNELTDWSMKREGQNYLLTIGPQSNKKQSIGPRFNKQMLIQSRSCFSVWCLISR